MFLFLFQAVGDFAHFEQLRWEDQEKIRQRIEAGPGPGKKTTFFAIWQGRKYMKKYKFNAFDMVRWRLKIQYMLTAEV
jgi:hypothetical protein